MRLLLSNPALLSEDSFLFFFILLQRNHDGPGGTARVINSLKLATVTAISSSPVSWFRVLFPF